ncbi:hypothetical protein C8R43DRAFT_1118494 [Mycena crocata]|nr:hypothetical protein C8R43DRAFT_1118494 [Mycena crocata]
MAPVQRQGKKARKRKGSTLGPEAQSAQEEIAAEKRREAAAKYYRGHPELREKNRLHAQHKRHALRLSKRQWDPSKDCEPTPKESISEPTPKESEPTPLNEQSLRRLGSLKSTVILSEPGDRDNQPVHSLNNSASGFCVAQRTVHSRTSAERIAAAALAALALGSPPQEVKELTDEQWDAIMASDTSSGVGVAHESPWAAPPKQSIAGNRDGEPSDRVNTAQKLVAKLNRGPLSGPTPAEVYLWNDVIVDVPPFLKTMRAKEWMKVEQWAQNVASFGQDGLTQFLKSEREWLEARERLTVQRMCDQWGHPTSDI